MLSALRHRTAELGERATLVRAATYTQGLAEAGVAGPVSVCDPTPYPARRLVRRLAAAGSVQVLASRGYAVPETGFAHWAAGRGQRRLLMEDFYREVRRHHRLLLTDGGDPLGGRWNYDHDNRDAPPKGARTLSDALDVADPWWPTEDDVDAAVREDLDRMVRDEGVELVGDDGRGASR